MTASTIVKNLNATYTKKIGSIYPTTITAGLKGVFVGGDTLEKSRLNRRTNVKAVVTGAPTVDANSIELTGNAKWLLTDVPQTPDFTIVSVVTADPDAVSGTGSFVIAATQNTTANTILGAALMQNASADNLGGNVRHYDGDVGAGSIAILNNSLSYAAGSAAAQFEFQAMRNISAAKATKLYRRVNGVNTSLAGAYNPGTNVRDMRDSAADKLFTLGSFSVASTLYAGTRKVAVTLIWNRGLSDFEIDQVHADLIAFVAPRGIATL